MSGWKEIKVGSVQMVHMSTASVMNIVVRDKEGVSVDVWLDYAEFEDLAKAMSQVDPNNGWNVKD